MYCKNCNKMIPDTTSFCPYCGTPQQAQQNQPVGYQQDDSATVLVQDGNMGYPNGGFQPPVNPGYQQPAVPAYQQPVNPGYQAPVTPDYPQQGQNAGFQPQMPPVNPAFQQPAPQKKSKTGLIIGLVVGGLVLVGIIVGVLIAVFSVDDSYSESYNDSVISDDFLDDSYDDVFDDSNNDSYDDSYDDSYNDTSDDSVNPEFEALFDKVGIELIAPEDFGAGYEYAAFAWVDEYNELFLHEYAYIGDTVYERLETVIYPVAGFTQSEKDEFIEDMDATYADADALDCVSVSHYIVDEDFIVYEIRYNDLDSYSAIVELQDAGLVGSGYVTSISFEMTEESLLADGYVKR